MRHRNPHRTPIRFAEAILARIFRSTTQGKRHSYIPTVRLRSQVARCCVVEGHRHELSSPDLRHRRHGGRHPHRAFVRAQRVLTGQASLISQGGPRRWEGRRSSSIPLLRRMSDSLACHRPAALTSVMRITILFPSASSLDNEMTPPPVLIPSRPVSRSACHTHLRSVLAVHPTFVAIDRMAAHCDPGSCAWSCTSRTVRSRTSGEYRVRLSIAPTSQPLEPPAIPGRFTGPVPDIASAPQPHRVKLPPTSWPKPRHSTSVRSAFCQRNCFSVVSPSV